MKPRSRMPNRVRGHASGESNGVRAAAPAKQQSAARRGKRAQPSKGCPKPARTRRTAPEARQRILEAAARELLRVGPEALRLTDLARQLQLSHPAILHHFGSREGLVAAVVEHSMHGLTQQLMAALDSATVTRVERIELVDMVSDVCRSGGLARLLAFLLLSDRDNRAHASGQAQLKPLVDAAHDLRQRLGHSARYEDTLFEVQLLAIVLLGDAIFGDAVRGACGVSEGQKARRDFRQRLTRLLPP